jgi:hypothetical protein
MNKEEFLKLAEKRWESINDLSQETNFYDYESKFDQIWVDLGKEILEASISNKGQDRRKKKGLRPGMAKFP